MGSLQTWQRVPFTSGDSLGYRRHEIYGERRKPAGASSFERRYKVTGPLVNGYFPSVSAAKSAIVKADTAKREAQAAAAEQEQQARVEKRTALVQKQIASSPRLAPTTSPTVTRVIRVEEKSAPGQPQRTTQPTARAPVDIPDPRVQASGRSTTPAPTPEAQQSKKKSNALLIAAIIGVPIVAGMFID